MQKNLLTMFGSLLANAAVGKEQGKIESRSIEVQSDVYQYQIYTPPHVEKEQSVPVIVFLHGIRERGSGGFVPTTGAAGALVKHYFTQVPAIVLIPQCRQGSYWSDPVMDEMVMKSLAQTLEEFGAADETRIYLIGVSMGGYGVWHFAANHPNRFAALVSICGGSSIIKGDRFDALARKVGKTPARLYHGSDDRIVPASESRNIAKALESNGGNVEYKEYEGVGHHVWLNVLGEKDLLPWLVAQRLR